MPGKNKKLTHKTLLKADRNSQEAASAARLSYVNNNREGITRVKKGKNYVYYFGNRQVRKKQDLERIRKLAIPPSWKDVWICKSPNGHIQATGLDLKNRKQYRYHSKWNELKNTTKFHRLYEFGKTLPGLRKRIRKDSAAKDLQKEKVLATAIDLMDKTYIRIGSNGYEKMNGSYGLTTLKDRHVTISKDKILFSFTGKKGVAHRISLKNKRLARIVKDCKDIPGKTLFQYYDQQGKQHAIDSGMVNDYIKQITGEEFSAKDFRTWAGSVQAVEYLRSGQNDNNINGKKLAVDMLDAVSEKLGNTRNVCKKYYVHPRLISLCEEKTFKEEMLKGVGKKESSKSFTEGENILMCILRKGVVDNKQ
jgi:DNA topoisomerase I